MIYITRRKELAIGFPSPLSVLPKVLRGSLGALVRRLATSISADQTLRLMRRGSPYRLVPIRSETNGTRYSWGDHSFLIGCTVLISGALPTCAAGLALLWQIYSRRFSMPIHFRQCGHRFDGS